MFYREHIHHGYFGKDGIDRLPSIEAKEVLINKLFEFADLENVKSCKSSKKVKILDIGCGIGGSSRFLAKLLQSKGYTVQTVGVTLSPKQVERATELTKQADLSNVCSFQVADALDLPFKKGTFDIVWSLESGEHMPDKKKFIAEAHRVLKPGGKIMVATWCTKEPEKLADYEKYSLDIIYKEWALPFFISLPEYKKIFTDVAFKEIQQDDWSKAVAKTWTQAVWDGFYGIFWLLLRGPRVFYRTLKDCYAIYHMNRGYSRGYVVYGLIIAVK